MFRNQKGLKSYSLLNESLGGKSQVVSLRSVVSNRDVAWPTGLLTTALTSSTTSILERLTVLGKEAVADDGPLFPKTREHVILIAQPQGTIPRYVYLDMPF